MAVYNLQAFADRTRYLMDTMGMDKAEAEKKVFGEAGVGELDVSAREEYTRLLQEGSEQSKYARNDIERVIDRQEAAKYETYDTNPDALEETDTTTPTASEPKTDETF